MTLQMPVADTYANQGDQVMLTGEADGGVKYIDLECTVVSIAPTQRAFRAMTPDGRGIWFDWTYITAIQIVKKFDQP